MAWRAVAAVLLVAACGGRSVRHDASEPLEPFEPSTGGTGGTAAGTGGTSAAAGNGATGGVHPTPLPEPEPHCFSERGSHALGEQEVLPDGCTVCTCRAWGLECISDACENRTECENLADEYQRALLASRWCGPVNIPIDQHRFRGICQEVARSRPECGCSVVVRGSLTTDDVEARWFGAGCAGMLPCPPCEPLPPGPLHCGADGFCTAGQP